MLEVAGLTVSYGAVAAVKDLSLSIPEGQVVTLIGPNGAGKSTLINAISGLLSPSVGSIRFDGVEIGGRGAAQVARLGLIQVPEGRQILGPLSVEENLLLGRLALGRRARHADDLERVFALFPILAERRRQEGGSLSGGQQQMLAIGRALMGRPRFLMLDEPSLGLSPLLAQQVFAALASLRHLGLTIMLVEQNAKRALGASDTAYVIEQGRIVRHGSSPELARDPEIAAHYLPDADFTLPSTRG